MKIEINPQQVLMLVEQYLDEGWVQGHLQGGALGQSETQDPQGVCILGAIAKALNTTLETVLRPEIEQQLELVPEFQTLDVRTKREFVTLQLGSLRYKLRPIFESKIQEVLGAQYGAISIPGWNDAPQRRKDEILTGIRAALEIVTTECLEAWAREDHVVTELSTEPIMVPAVLRKL
jgi:hypothetical protein